MGLTRVSVGFVSVLVLLVIASSAEARVIEVTAPDLMEFDWTINGEDGFCSFREAIIAADTDQTSGSVEGECPAGQNLVADVVVLPAGTYVIEFAGDVALGESDARLGDLDITSSMVIRGAGAATTIITAEHGGRFFQIRNNNRDANVVIEGLTLQGGNSAEELGGTIYVSSGTNLSIFNSRIENSQSSRHGGAIANLGGLQIFQSTLTGNSSGDQGGAIFNGSQLTVSNSTFSHNASDVAGGGISSHNLATTFINNSSFGSNRASNGGGGVSSRGFLSLTASSFTENEGRVGGGLDTSGPSRIAQSSFVNNTAQHGGGASVVGNALITNSTFSENHAEDPLGGNGGGLYVSGAVGISHTTIANNHARHGGGILVSHAEDVIALKNVLIGNNHSVLGVDDENYSPDCYGPLQSLGHNLIGNTVGCTVEAGETDLIAGHNGQADSIDPRTGELQSLGGMPAVQTLLADSPALQVGTCTGLAGDTIRVDQLNITRPQGAGCEIGAQEYIAPEIIENQENQCPVAPFQANAGPGDPNALVVANNDGGGEAVAGEDGGIGAAEAAEGSGADDAADDAADNAALASGGCSLIRPS